MEAKAFDTLDSLVELDLLVLRGHALVEAFLWELLAERLAVHESDLPALTFDRLARLATSGDRYAPIREHLLLLNEIRNGIAHRFEPSRHRLQLEHFVRRGFSTMDARFPDSGSMKLTFTYSDENPTWPEDAAKQPEYIRTAIKLLIVSLRFVSGATEPPEFRKTSEAKE